MRQLLPLLGWLAVLAAAAQDTRFELRQGNYDPPTGGAAQWGDNAVILALDADGGAVSLSRTAIEVDFEAEVSVELLDWPQRPDLQVSLMYATGSPMNIEAERAYAVRIGRELDLGLDQYRTGGYGGAWGQVLSALGLADRFRLQLVRRDGEVRTAFDEGDGWQSLQHHRMPAGVPAHIVVGITRQARGEVREAPVRVRFSDLKVTIHPARRPGGAGGAGAGGGAGSDWVIYHTGPGWLRVGSRAEFNQPRQMAEEIWGGNSTDPLPKTLLVGGLPNREAALEVLCARLTKVHYDINALRGPRQVVRAIFGEGEYYLRLAGGMGEDVALHRAEEYDLAAERAILSAHGITPRWDLGRLYLIHAKHHGTREGIVEDNRWMLFSAEPKVNKKNPAEGIFHLPDGWGGVFIYIADEWEGPYRDNFGLARAMRRLGITELELWPPMNRDTPRVVAAEVPDDARDHGAAVQGVQPIVEPPALRDWVVYLTADRWLHIGTRTEFETVVPQAQTIWSGTSDQPVQKVLVDFGTPFNCYEQALEAVVGALTEVTVARHPNNQPRETVAAKIAGRDVMLHLARGPYDLVAGYGGYDFGAEFALMLAHGKPPLRRFGPVYLVHATGHGTINGPVVDDHWMLVTDQPQNGGVRVPDGLGGTFGYSVDRVAGPISDSQVLAAAMKANGVESVGLWDGLFFADELDPPLTRREPPRETRIVSITPDRGDPSSQFYVTIVAEGMRPWYGFSLGPGIVVTDPTCLGANPDGPGERWLATVTVAEGARFGQ